ncbi:translocon-associated protein subunit delta-like [Diorhabda sublineata]|uniref:translocon-associated protein subunit delta-like n=1 Tax=Diorhabda sublineata TaxID=1163346 RepID=UPI0024E12C08|nr:translocon-associated protein subunit delta-like [Diorhabda sublineata]XP_056646879.1 translocon-associated protein subunit delta-like [Diorhabda sublineata]
MAKKTLISFFMAMSCSLCLGCSNPEIISTSFTTLDATIVRNIAYIADFSVKCKSGNIGNLYAAFDRQIGPVSIVGNNRFQVSWTEESKSAKSGERVIRLFDEDGYTVFRKAIRAKEDTSNVQSFANVVVNHPGAYNGPWLKSEFIATMVSLTVAYIAIASRAKLVM